MLATHETKLASQEVAPMPLPPPPPPALPTQPIYAAQQQPLSQPIYVGQQQMPTQYPPGYMGAYPGLQNQYKY